MAVAIKIKTETKIKPKKDPRCRKDGRCVVCKGERPIVAVNYSDPFCSTQCCRKWCGTEGI